LDFIFGSPKVLSSKFQVGFYSLKFRNKIPSWDLGLSYLILPTWDLGLSYFGTSNLGLGAFLLGTFNLVLGTFLLGTSN